MAVYTYGASNVTFESFQTWSNSITSSQNIELGIAVNDMYPANAAPFQISDFAPNTSIFYGVFHPEDGGSVSITAPYTVAASTTAITAKNILISTYAITVVAASNYPFTFHSWRDAAAGAGTSLSTNATLTLTDVDHTGVETFYAYFTTSHINPYDTAF